MRLHYTCRYCGEQRTVDSEDGTVELGLRNGSLVVLELDKLPACTVCATRGNLREVLDNDGYVLKRQVQFLAPGGKTTTRHGSFDGVPAVRDAE